MTGRLLYPHGRASALPGGTHPGKLDYDLVAHLRAVREDGDEAMIAAEEYDPNFSLKLSECTDDAAAEALLGAWLERRAAVLRRTQDELRRTWREARQHRTTGA